MTWVHIHVWSQMNRKVHTSYIHVLYSYISIICINFSNNYIQGLWIGFVQLWKFETQKQARTLATVLVSKHVYDLGYFSAQTSKCLLKWIKVDKWDYFRSSSQDFFSLFCFLFSLLIFIYFCKFETFIRSSAWSLVIQIQIQAACYTKDKL